MTEEIWKDIPGYEGLYKASSLGNIKTLKRNRVPEDLVLSPRKDKAGYLMVNLYKDKKQKSYRIHRLIVSAFEGLKEGMVIDHINNIKADNRFCNLQQTTNRHNCSKDRVNKTSKYTGVSWDKSRGRWKAFIQSKGEIHCLGSFILETEAYSFYENALYQLENNLPISKKRRKTTSSFTGVSWHKATEKWISQIVIDKKKTYLGTFNTELEAHEAYKNRLKEVQNAAEH